MSLVRNFAIQSDFMVPKELRENMSLEQADQVLREFWLTGTIPGKPPTPPAIIRRRSTTLVAELVLGLRSSILPLTPTSH